MRLFALTVGRNERYRYLEPMLAHMKEIVDDHFFFDDQSDDGTEKLAAIAGCEVRVRSANVPGFSLNEGMFRNEAWRMFEIVMEPRIGDWVLVIDCDEFLVSRLGGRDRIRQDVEMAILNAGGSRAINLDIPEVFGVSEEGTPLVRQDRLWGTIHAPRLFAYQPGGQYFHGPVGVPAVPSYVMSGVQWGGAPQLALMHYGYAREVDQQAKYERYNGRAGHGDAHVQSIISPDKELTRWPYHSPSLLAKQSTS